ncbi:minor capsid protein [Enterococcus faecium]|uniref:minor capsid protein n=1 Tax=Enterococcus faecium TaxID=1352 RepID=UPI000BF015C5|nr:minor capsid protein [Enterococcus faecium]PEH49311.1 phage head morphogenesis protein [Enterococcus faecium]
MANTNKSQQYWINRMDEIMAYVDQTDLNFFDDLQSIYIEARQDVQKEIYAFYAQFAKDNKISLQEAKQRLMQEDLSDYRENAKKYFKQAEKDQELLKRLNEQYKAGKVTRLEALQLDLTYQLGKLRKELNQSFESYLKETAKYAYRKVAFGNSASTLNEPALKKLIETPFNGKNYSQSIWGNIYTLANDLKELLTKGFVKGLGPAEMARELRKKYNVARSRAEAIVRTDGTNIINNATIKRYKEAGLTKYQFLAHLDSRTTDTCKRLNDKIFDIEDYQPGLNAPPMHVNCRSTIVPDDYELNSNADLKSINWDKELEGLSNGVSDLINGFNKEAFQYGKKNGEEILGIIDNITGKLLGKYTGGIDSVTLDKEIQDILEKSTANSLVLSHNHPSQFNSSFSIPDITQIVKYPSIKSMLVVTENGTIYLLDRNGKKISWFNKAKYFANTEKIQEKYIDKYGENDEMWSKIVDERNKEIADLLKIIYKKVN